MGEEEKEVVEVLEMTTQVLIEVPLCDTILLVIGPISFCPKQMSCQSLSLPCPASPGQAETSYIYILVG